MIKTIATLNGTDFLRRINHVRKAVEAPLKELDIMSIMHTPPVLTGEETAEEKTEKVNAQTKVNISAALDRALEEKPEETIKLLNLLIINDDQELDGLDYVIAGMELLLDDRVVHFLSLLMKSGLMNMGA